jgi:uncharacterized protein (TIGR01319 family)
VSPPVVVCVDVGSTFTKLAAVDVRQGRLLATASQPTTVDTDVLRGVDAGLATLRAALPGTDLSTVYACSSAGGGLRLAVVGYEEMVSAQAGARVALSAGARVVHVAAGPLTGAGVRALRSARPDVVLLVGGTDGGDADVVRHNAARLAAARLRVPVVVAGNVEVRDELVGALARAAVPVVAADNVLPRIGVLDPRSARSAIREVFLRHVIGGKHLSRSSRFARLVRGATPDVVLTAVELLADAGCDALLVVDVGGATTDVYSALRPPPDRPGHVDGEVAGVLWRSRTVEGDLGVRWNAPGVVAAAAAERLLADGEAPRLAAAARRRAAQPGLVAGDAGDAAVDARLAQLAAVLAVRRHARGEAVAAGQLRRGGRDLREVTLVVGSGGVLRHASPRAAGQVLAAAVGDRAGGWPLPRHPRCWVDRDYVLAPAGLLAADHPDAALALLRHHRDR